MKSHEDYMRMAMDAAVSASRAGEVPIGAVLVDAVGEILAVSGNTTRRAHDPAGHAELNVLRQAGRELGNHRLLETSLYVTLEPCTMCAGVISHARVKRLVIAASDPKGGAVWNGVKFFDQPTCHWRPEIVQGPLAEESGEMLRIFFRERRAR